MHETFSGKFFLAKPGVSRVHFHQKVPSVLLECTLEIKKKNKNKKGLPKVL